MRSYATICLVIHLFATIREGVSSNERVKEKFSLTEKPLSVTNFCRSMPDWTMVADPTNCRKFHACVGSTSQEFECADHFHFNRTILRCMPGECPQNNEELCRNHEALPVPNDCYKFTYCVAGKRELRKCPENYYFDNEAKICQMIVDSPDFQCRCGDRSNHATFTNTADCATYYRCVNDRAMLYKCPLGQYYNESINSCLQDYEGICLKPDNNTFCKGLGDGFKEALFQALPGDCTKFKICVFGRIFIQQCHDGLYYDADKHFCRFSWEHKCHEPTSEWEKENKIDGNKKHSSHTAHNHKIPNDNSKVHNVVVVSKEKPAKTNSKLRYDKFSSRFVKF